MNNVYKKFEKKMTKDVPAVDMQAAIDELKTELKALGVEVKEV